MMVVLEQSARTDGHLLMCNNMLGCVVRELIIYSKGNRDTCKSAPVTKIFLDFEIRFHLIPVID
jgi:hypothetical protein